MRFFILCLLLLAGTAPPARAESDPSGSGLQFAVAGDIVGRFGLTQQSGVLNRLEPREAEVLAFAPIDHLFDGQLSLAAHQEDGKAFFEIHEMFIGSTKLIPRSRFRVGQFFLGVGRLNQFHRHDWPFITAPRVQREFFNAEEGTLDTGIEYSWLTPLPFYFDVTAGITNGWVFGHSHDLGTKPYVPTHYLRAATYTGLPGNGGTQIGFNYIGRKDSAGTGTTLLGIDATAKWREAQFLRFLFQSEIFLRMQTPKGGDTTNTLAFYLYPQYALDQNLSIGLRFDGYTVLGLKNALGQSAGNFEYALVPTVTYKASEFSTIRAAYTHLDGEIAGVNVSSQRIVELQAVFILGAHPAHDF